MTAEATPTDRPRLLTNAFVLCVVAGAVVLWLDVLGLRTIRGGGVAVPRAFAFVLVSIIAVGCAQW